VSLLEHTGQIPCFSQLILAQATQREKLNGLGALDLAALSALVVEVLEVGDLVLRSLLDGFEYALVLKHI
jgi:hypothetical protein